MSAKPPSEDSLEEAARLAAERRDAGRAHPEPSLGARLGQIGVLGWTIVLPALGGLMAGRWLDQRTGSGVFFSAPLTLLGAGLGLWLAYRWMSRQ
jgi:ATP synthase protein I